MCHRPWYVWVWPAPALVLDLSMWECRRWYLLSECCCSLHYSSTGEKWEMQRLKATRRAAHWGFNLTTCAGGPCALLSPSAPIACFVPQGSKLPGSPWGNTSPAPVPQLPPSSSSWPAFEQHVLKEQHFGCPLELGLRNAVVFGWRIISFLLFLQRTMGVRDSSSHKLRLCT